MKLNKPYYTKGKKQPVPYYPTDQGKVNKLLGKR